MTIFTGGNEVVAKVIFLHLFVILFTGGVCLSACWDTTPPEQTPPGVDTPPEQQTPPKSRPPPGKQTSAYGLRAAYWNAFLLTTKLSQPAHFRYFLKQMGLFTNLLITVRERTDKIVKHRHM